MPRFFFFFNSLTKKKKMTSVGASRRAADSGFVGVLVLVEQVELVRDGQKATEAHLLFFFKKRKNEILQSCTDPSRTDAQSEEAQLFSHRGEKAPNTTMLPSLGNRRARMIRTGKMT